MRGIHLPGPHRFPHLPRIPHRDDLRALLHPHFRPATVESAATACAVATVCAAAYAGAALLLL